MITRIVIRLTTIPFKVILFLISPRYFKTKSKNLGKILNTNDRFFSTDKYAKPNRKVIVTSDNGKNIKVNKITTDKRFSSNSSKLQIDKQKKYSTRIDYKKYTPVLTKESVVDKRQYSINTKTGKDFKLTDSEFSDTGMKISNKDLKRINKKNK